MEYIVNGINKHVKENKQMPNVEAKNNIWHQKAPSHILCVAKVKIPVSLHSHFPAKMSILSYLLLSIFLTRTVSANFSHRNNTCRSFCGNLTIDYPFATRSGCGHFGYRDLLFCVNDVLMFHIPSGSYRVLEIDYAFQTLTLSDPAMSTCNRILRDGKGNGFEVEAWRTPYLNPAPDNIFMLLGCHAQSPLFQGFPGKHLPCRNVSSMGCEGYQACPAWTSSGSYKSERHTMYGLSPPDCCSVSFDSIRSINLTRLKCQGYSSAYSLAPIHVSSPNSWSYGIRVIYSVPGDFSFCRSCEATGGTCGYDADAVSDLCYCGGWNSTSNCDKGSSIIASVGRQLLPSLDFKGGLWICYLLIWTSLWQISK